MAAISVSHCPFHFIVIQLAAGSQTLPSDKQSQKSLDSRNPPESLCDPHLLVPSLLLSSLLRSAFLFPASFSRLPPTGLSFQFPFPPHLSFFSPVPLRQLVSLPPTLTPTAVQHFPSPECLLLGPRPPLPAARRLYIRVYTTLRTHFIYLLRSASQTNVLTD